MNIIDGIVFLLKLIWNILMCIIGIILTMWWIGFVCSSVVGVVLILIFTAGIGFFFPFFFMTAFIIEL